MAGNGNNNYQKTEIRRLTAALQDFRTEVNGKLEELSKAMIQLARAEEKMSNYDQRFQFIERDLNNLGTINKKLEGKITALEKDDAVSNTKQTIFYTLFTNVAKYVGIGTILVIVALAGAHGDTILSILKQLLG